MRSYLATLFALFGLLLLVQQSSAQIQCAISAANHLKDYGFETGSTYCRANSGELDADAIDLCVIGYDGRNLTYALESPTQTNLSTSFAPGGWTSTGEVDVITGNYQFVHGFWGLKLNGQFAAGSVSQSFQITDAAAQCNAQFYAATNSHSPYNWTATYTMTVSKGATVVSSQTLKGPPNTPTQGNILSSVTTSLVTLPGAGTYTLTFTSDDNTPQVFNDGEWTTQTYYGRTGIVIDDICFSCLVTPSPSVTPSASPPPSVSRSSAPSQSSSPAPSVSPSPSAQPAPSCPAFIVDDEDNWEYVPHREDDDDSKDSTTINVYFADILNGAKW